MSFSFGEPDYSGIPAHSAGAPARSIARTDAPPRCGGIGLDHSQTSRNLLRVDPRETRLNRLRRSTITAARLHQEAVTQGGFRGRWAFLTLTYREVGDWSPKHVSELLGHVRKWFTRRLVRCGYVWVAELQKRGAMHYHLLIWLPKGLTLPKPDKQGWWPHGWTKIEWARNPVGYMAKYASKGDSGANFPKGARLYGSGGLTGGYLLESRYWKRPCWLREISVIEQPICRRHGGGWLDRGTGEIFHSPWGVLFEFGQIYIYRKDSGPHIPCDYSALGLSS